MVSNVNFWPLLDILNLETVAKKRYEKGNEYSRTITILVTRGQRNGNETATLWCQKRWEYCKKNGKLLATNIQV